MKGETNLPKLLAAMRPLLDEQPYVFCSLPANRYQRLQLEPLALFHEQEGLSIIVTPQAARQNGLPFDTLWACITLGVHSALSAVGLLAAVTGRLAQAGISVNAVSAYHHDHLFVPWDRRRQVMEMLADWSQSQAGEDA